MSRTPSSPAPPPPARPAAPTEAALDRAIDEARDELEAWIVTFTAGDGRGAEHGLALLRRLATAVTDHSRALRGLGLTIMVTAGLGLTDPQLVLMITAGYLVLLDATAGAPPDEPSFSLRAEPPPAPLDATLVALAARLGLPPPVALEQAEGRVLSLRGALEHTHLHLRAREGRRGWQVELTLGIPGRDRPDVELIPGAGGHRVRGDVRHLERLPEPLLAALADYPGHYTRLWVGGVQLEFGRQLAGLDPDRLARLLTQLIRVV